MHAVLLSLSGKERIISSVSVQVFPLSSREL